MELKGDRGRNKETEDITRVTFVFYLLPLKGSHLLLFPSNSSGKSKSNIINYLRDVAKDAVERAQTIDMVVDTLFLVPLYQRTRLVVVNVEAFLDGLRIVVRASALLTTLDETCHQLVLGNIEFYHRSHTMTALSKHRLQRLCLRYSTWEAIENHSLVLFAKTVIDTCEDAYHEVVGD